MSAASITNGAASSGKSGSNPRYLANQRMTTSATTIPVKMKIAYHRIVKPKKSSATGSESFGTRSARVISKERVDLINDRERIDRSRPRGRQRARRRCKSHIVERKWLPFAGNQPRNSRGHERISCARWLDCFDVERWKMYRIRIPNFELIRKPRATSAVGQHDAPASVDTQSIENHRDVFRVVQVEQYLRIVETEFQQCGQRQELCAGLSRGLRVWPDRRPHVDIEADWNACLPRSQNRKLDSFARGLSTQRYRPDHNRGQAGNSCGIDIVDTEQDISLPHEPEMAIAALVLPCKGQRRIGANILSHPRTIDLVEIE